MTQLICDICRKPILKGEPRTKYRMQRQTWISLFAAEWKELDVHSCCAERLMQLIRKENENAEN